MTKLIKTDFDISKEVDSVLSKQQFDDDENIATPICEKKYLVLPEGLNKLEEMLCDPIRQEFFAKNYEEHIRYVFNRFKKENEI